MTRRALSAQTRPAGGHKRDSGTLPPLRDLLATRGALLWTAKKAVPWPSVQVTIADAVGRRWTCHWDGLTHGWLSCSSKPCETATRRVLAGLWLRWPRTRLLEDDPATVCENLFHKNMWHDHDAYIARNEAPQRQHGHVPKQRYGDDGAET